MALGEILKNARVQRGMTPSDVAESTHLMVQIVEDLEREDFRRIAAPIYGRGFIKLYATVLELDPEPLIRDFMDLYAGSRAPAVRTKKQDEQDVPSPESAPLTRTVSGASPQRQMVQPRPAVRPLSMPQPQLSADQTLPAIMQPSVSAPELARDAETEHAKEGPSPIAHEEFFDRAGGLVVEPESLEQESEEPDLFRPHSLRRKPQMTDPLDEDSSEAAEPRASRKPRLPIFKVGGRMDGAGEPVEQDAAAGERRRARIQAFVNGVTKLKEGVERNLPSALPHKQMLALGGLGVAALVFMAVGIHYLFKMTGTEVLETPNAIVKVVPPPPDVYVD